MPALLALIGSAVGKYLTDGALKFIAFKLFMTSCFLVLLPFALKAVITWFFDGVYALMNTYMSGSTVGESIITLTGVGAYMGSHMNLPLAFGIIISAVCLRFSIKLIPGV